MNNIALNDILNIIEQKNSAVIISHVRPDGDTLSCAFAMKKLLEHKGKKAVCVCSDKPSAKLSFLCDSPVLYPDELSDNFEYDLVISVDVASRSMLGKCESLFDGRTSIKIDHHNSGDDFALYNYADPNSASCTEIIYDLIKMSNAFSNDICDLLYAGISSDTGCFKYSNVTQSTHLKAAFLISQGVKTAEINTKLFDNRSKAEITALKLAYNNISFYENGKIALICVTNRMKEENGLCEDDLADISAIQREIENVLIGITIKQKTDCPNEYKISIRSHTSVNAAEICKRLGGGGHACAAGGMVKANSTEEAVKKVLDQAVLGL